MQKFKHRKGDKPMLSDELLEKILAHEDSHRVPFGCQSTMIHVFEEVLSEIREENPYATISELLSTDATTNV